MAALRTSESGESFCVARCKYIKYILYLVITAFQQLRYWMYICFLGHLFVNSVNLEY